MCSVALACPSRLGRLNLGIPERLIKSVGLLQDFLWQANFLTTVLALCIGLHVTFPCSTVCNPTVPGTVCSDGGAKIVYSREYRTSTTGSHASCISRLICGERETRGLV